MSDSIKKGIKLVAFAFLFTLVNLNLTINSVKINITPDFIGWILFTLAFDNLGEYAEDRKYLKYVSMVMIVLTGAQWILSIMNPDLEIGILNTVTSIISAVYMFMLMESLIRIADDIGSVRADTLRFLRWANPAVTVAIGLVGLMFLNSQEVNTVNAVATILVMVIGITVAIMTAVTLFRLYKDVRES